MKSAIVLVSVFLAVTDAGYVQQSYSSGWDGSNQGQGWTNNYGSPHSSQVEYTVSHQPSYGGWASGYSGPQHIPVLDKHGVPVETPEVQHAKQQHLQAHNLAKLQHNDWQQGSGYGQGSSDYGSSYGYSHNSLTAHGVPEDTPEVKLARAQHLAAYAEEQAKHSQWAGSYGSNGYSNSHY